ncbi:MAG: hypothetical protein IPI73_10660 [Betaproteobacteria bacterium]|nr:hypothetical protein [Betaproteobacteria bacterium]
MRLPLEVDPRDAAVVEIQPPAALTKLPPTTQNTRIAVSLSMGFYYPDFQENNMENWLRALEPTQCTHRRCGLPRAPAVESTATHIPRSFTTIDHRTSLRRAAAASLSASCSSPTD